MVGSVFPNISSQIKKDYNSLNQLRTINSLDKVVTINYRNIDTNSQEVIKRKIAQFLNEYLANYRESISEDTKKYISDLQHKNSTDSITIEYEKFKDDNIASQFREALQFVLIKRCNELYLNMTLNPTV